MEREEMPRQAGLDSPGTLHHVMIRGIESGEIVRGMKDREEFVKRMGMIAGETGTRVYAWALMADHAHILLRSGPGGLSGTLSARSLGFTRRALPARIVRLHDGLAVLIVHAFAHLSAETAFFRCLRSVCHGGLFCPV